MGAYLVWKPKSGNEKTLYFDVCTSETQMLTTTITEHPVEEGPNVADHMRRDLDGVTLEVFVSNSPVYDVNSRGGKVVAVELKIEPYEAPLEFTPGSAYNAIGGAIKGAISSLLGRGEKKYAAQVMKFDDTFDAVGETLTLLRGIRSQKVLVDVMLPSRIYQNMALVSVEVARSRETGDGARFTLEFKEIRKVKVSVVDAPTPTEPRAKPAAKRGAKDAKDAANAGKKKSLLSSLLGKP